MTDAALSAAILAALPPWPEWARLEDVANRLNLAPTTDAWGMAWTSAYLCADIEWGFGDSPKTDAVRRARPTIAIPVEARRVMGEAVRRG